MFSEAINIGLWTLSGISSLPLAGLSLEIFLALLPGKAGPNCATAMRPRIAVLIPAHNESAMIGATVGQIKAQLLQEDQLVVVADNCTDNTAELARGAGAEVIIRQNAEQRGKGFALDYGVRHISNHPPEILIIVDSDVSIRSGSLDALARQALITGKPAQSVYVLQAPVDSGMKDQISHIAFTVRNRIRPRGLMRLAGICPMFGAGMAFPWEIISKAPLASGNIVEDLALALDLSSQGTGPMLCEAARVDGTLVSLSHNDNLKQRRRWEHGHMRTILTHAPKVILNGLLHLRLRTVVLGLDVMIPPLSLTMALGLLISIALIGAGFLPGVSIYPAIMLCGWLIVSGCLIVLSWLKFAECEKPIRPLLAIPGYILRKLPMYASFFTSSEKSWNRAARPGDPGPRPSTTHNKHAA